MVKNAYVKQYKLVEQLDEDNTEYTKKINQLAKAGWSLRWMIDRHGLFVSLLERSVPLPKTPVTLQAESQQLRCISDKPILPAKTRKAK